MNNTFPLVVRCISDDWRCYRVGTKPTFPFPKKGGYYLAIAERCFEKTELKQFQIEGFDSWWGSEKFVVEDDGVDRLLKEINNEIILKNK